MVMTEAQIAWLAGLFEGEGCLYHKKKRWSVVITMTDEDIICRVHALTGIGRLYGPYQYKKHHKPIWSWRCDSPHEARPLIEALQPWMGQRRSEKFQELLDADLGEPVKAYRRHNATECLEGHALEGENLRTDGSCRTCYNAYMREWHTANKERRNDKRRKTDRRNIDEATRAAIAARYADPGITQQQVADEFGVNQSTVSLIVRGK